MNYPELTEKKGGKERKDYILRMPRTLGYSRIHTFTSAIFYVSK